VASRFKLPFSERERFARNKRDRYYRDPVYRLKRINETRQRSGQAPYETLDEVKLRVVQA
jgi:hypothetical protein